MLICVVSSPRNCLPLRIVSSGRLKALSNLPSDYCRALPQARCHLLPCHPLHLVHLQQQATASLGGSNLLQLECHPSLLPQHDLSSQRSEQCASCRDITNFWYSDSVASSASPVELTKREKRIHLSNSCTSVQPSPQYLPLEPRNKVCPEFCAPLQWLPGLYSRQSSLHRRCTLVLHRRRLFFQKHPQIGVENPQPNLLYPLKRVVVPPQYLMMMAEFESQSLDPKFVASRCTVHIPLSHRQVRSLHLCHPLSLSTHPQIPLN